LHSARTGIRGGGEGERVITSKTVTCQRDGFIFRLDWFSFS